MLELFIIGIIVLGVYAIYEKLRGKPPAGRDATGRNDFSSYDSDRRPDIGRNGPDRPADNDLDDGNGGE